MKDKGKSRGQRKKEKKEIKKQRKRQKQVMGRTFIKTKNIAAFTYYILGILFFTITLLILLGILTADTIVSWFGG